MATEFDVAPTALRPLIVDIARARRVLGGVSRSTFYARLLPRLETVRIGSRVYIVSESIDRLVAELRAEPGAR